MCYEIYGYKKKGKEEMLLYNVKVVLKKSAQNTNNFHKFSHQKQTKQYEGLCSKYFFSFFPIKNNHRTVISNLLLQTIRFSFENNFENTKDFVFLQIKRAIMARACTSSKIN